jgi:hypothetical protein
MILKRDTVLLFKMSGGHFPLSCRQSCRGWRGRFLIRLPVKSPELVSFFIESSSTLKSIFLNNKDAKNFKTIGAYKKSADLIFKTFKKIIHFVTLSL